MDQKTRNTIYAVAAALFVLGQAFGWLTEDQVDVGNDLIEQGIELGTQVVAFVGLVLAWVKSLTSRTTTLNVPKEDFEASVASVQVVEEADEYAEIDEPEIDTDSYEDV